ncbi:hypothetical protein F5888DRAFT_1170709 [Russula emetica]|nr:hypothetical protein F5888DRAFT_1170709 [Russula emetica]
MVSFPSTAEPEHPSGLDMLSRRVWSLWSSSLPPYVDPEHLVQQKMATQAPKQAPPGSPTPSADEQCLLRVMSHSHLWIVRPFAFASPLSHLSSPRMVFYPSLVVDDDQRTLPASIRTRRPVCMRSTYTAPHLVPAQGLSSMSIIYHTLAIQQLTSTDDLTVVTGMRNPPQRRVQIRTNHCYTTRILKLLYLLDYIFLCMMSARMGPRK